MSRQSKGKVTVDTSAGGTTIIAANPLRNGLILFNRGSVDVAVAFGETPVADEGAFIPAGGSFIFHYAGRPDGYDDLQVLECKGITASSSAVITYQEI